MGTDRAYSCTDNREVVFCESREDWVTDAHTFLRFRQKHQADPLETVFDKWEALIRESYDYDEVLMSRSNWAAYWAICGMPTVVPSQKLAASFMSTVVPADVATFVRSPWPAFLCIVPPGLLGIEESRIGVWMSRSLELSHHDKRYPDWDPGQNMRAFIQNGDTDEINMIGSEDLSALTDYDYSAGITDAQHEDGRKRGIRYVPTSRENRFFRLVCRVLFGCCAEFDTRTGVVIGPRPKSRKVHGRTVAMPEAWEVRLTRDVRVDCSDSVRSYLRGARGSLKTQHMVRGHWKNQPYGPQASLRKFIHIEPHWKGPAAAPIAVRSHLLTEAK